MSHSTELLEINNSYEFIDVGQNQFGTTSSERGNPVIKTFGLVGCAALALYDPEIRLGTLAHISPSVLMAQKMQEHAASLRSRGNVNPDLVLQQLNKLFYSLEDNGSANAKYTNRGNLRAWFVCSYDELMQGILQRVRSIGVNVEQEHTFKDEGITAVALDTSKGELFRLKPPVLTTLRMDSLDIMAAQAGNISRTADNRSL